MNIPPPRKLHLFGRDEFGQFRVHHIKCMRILITSKVGYSLGSLAIPLIRPRGVPVIQNTWGELPLPLPPAHRRGPLAYPRQHGNPWEVHRAAHPVGGSGVAAHARRPRDLVPHTWCMAARGPITHSSPSQITNTLIQNISEWEFPKLNLTVLLTKVTLVRNRLAYSKSAELVTAKITSLSQESLF